MSKKELTNKANALGKKAFETGMARSAAGDAAMQVIMSKLHNAGKGAAHLLAAWYSGYDKASSN